MWGKKLTACGAWESVVLLSGGARSVQYGGGKAKTISGGNYQTCRARVIRAQYVEQPNREIGRIL